jgi:hypothetical protein
VDRLGETLADLRALRHEHPELADVRLQISLPNPLDLAIFTLGSRSYPPFRYLPVFTQAAVEEVSAPATTAGQDVVWQLERPAVLIGMNTANQLPGGRAVSARLLAGQLARLPADTAVIVHLCYSDLTNTPCSPRAASARPLPSSTTSPPRSTAALHCRGHRHRASSTRRPSRTTLHAPWPTRTYVRSATWPSSTT